MMGKRGVKEGKGIDGGIVSMVVVRMVVVEVVVIRQVPTQSD